MTERHLSLGMSGTEARTAIEGKLGPPPWAVSARLMRGPKDDINALNVDGDSRGSTMDGSNPCVAFLHAVVVGVSSTTM